MIRVVLYVLLVMGAAAGFGWLADRPGTLTIDWLGVELQTTVFLAALALILFFATFTALVWLGVLTWTAPKRFAQKVRARRMRIGHEALRRGIFAAGAGDRVVAQKAGAVAKKNLPDEPLTLLLEAQAAQLNEDGIASRQAFERMLAKPHMMELGLRGLFMEARKANQQEAARQYAERALAVNPALPWPTAALFEMQCRDGDWRAALKTLGIAKQHRHLARSEADRRRALLLTALAAEIEDTQQGKALAYALEAYGMTPALTPAAVIAGRILAAQGNVARAAKHLASAWKTMPHPDIALVYAHARPGDSPKERLARVRSLVSSTAASLEGDIAVAVAAIEAQDWTAARSALSPHLKDPTVRVCKLMARIEAGQNRNAGKAREWLSKAARAKPDPVWMGPDGTVAQDWRPVAGGPAVISGYEWKVPPTAAGSSTAEPIPEMTALDLFKDEEDSTPVLDAASAADGRAETSQAEAAPRTATAGSEANGDDEVEILVPPAPPEQKALPAPQTAVAEAKSTPNVIVLPPTEAKKPATQSITDVRQIPWYQRPPAKQQRRRR
jgi:HemY protein